MSPSSSLGFTVGEGVQAEKGQCHAWTSCKGHLSNGPTEESSPHISNTPTSEMAQATTQDAPHNLPQQADPPASAASHKGQGDV